MIRWRLRMAAAERGVWTAAELRRILASEAGYELSAPSVTALMTQDPVLVKLTTLAALCKALRCTPNDLFELATTPAPRRVRGGPPASRQPDVPGLNGSDRSANGFLSSSHSDRVDAKAQSTYPVQDVISSGPLDGPFRSQNPDLQGGEPHESNPSGRNGSSPGHRY